MVLALPQLHTKSWFPSWRFTTPGSDQAPAGIHGSILTSGVMYYAHAGIEGTHY